MKLNHLDILEQCFREKFRGYSKNEVDNFLHLVADDFKELEEDLRQLKRKSERSDKLAHQIQEIRKELEEKNRIIAELEKAPRNGNGVFGNLTPDMLKEKAKRMVQVAKEKAELHRRKADQELEQIRAEIERLHAEKKNLMELIKSTAQNHMDSITRPNPEVSRPAHAAESKSKNP
ncbi:MAG: hypothetical protein COV67_04880 [Nitrospinae bacterium CG11_big_fil_rev_8_21_14_0_20_56_8]|nr:MAG: hypothetical protein COV67_04880 [Nitrospinae bacterium CG11_big_fil_rev_8_21_14_0_20_56_8]